MTKTMFSLPDLGEGLKEAEIVAWHVTPGDNCITDQPLVSVETDKAVVEVPSPHSGVLIQTFGAPGDLVEVGQPLAEFDLEARTDTGAVVGEIQPRPPSGSPETAPTSLPQRPVSQANDPKIKAAPAVRAYAWERGIDLRDVPATGPRGSVSRADIDRSLEVDDGEVRGTDMMDGPDWQELRGPRRAMADRMGRSHAEVVPATVTEQADINDWPDGESVTLRLVRAIAAGAGAEPALNAWYDGNKMARKFNRRIDVGIAADTPDGLFVPVLRDVANRDAGDLAAGFNRLRQAVRDRRVPPDEMRGQTISLSNYGMIAGRHSAMVVVPPQVAIIGAGRIEERVVSHGGGIAVRKTLPLSLTFDHRAVTGGEAARFLVALMTDLEKPA